MVRLMKRAYAAPLPADSTSSACRSAPTTQRRDVSSAAGDPTRASCTSISCSMRSRRTALGGPAPSFLVALAPAPRTTAGRMFNGRFGEQYSLCDGGILGNRGTG